MADRIQANVHETALRNETTGRAIGGQSWVWS
jgi:hypothetical protein